MNVMIPINYDGEQPTVSARALHTGLEVSRRFSVWFETNSQGFVENEDYTSVRESTEVRNNGANVIQNEAVELFKDYLVFATRLSKNSFVGVNQSKQTGKTGPDTADRLFNLIKKTILK